METVDAEALKLEDGIIFCKSADGTEFGIDSNAVDLSMKPVPTLHYETETITYIVKTDTLNEFLLQNEKKYSNHKKWTEAETKLLLAEFEAFKKKVEQRKIKTLSKVWEPIATILSNQGCEVTPIQAENRLKTLKRDYLKTVKDNKRTGNSRRACAFEKELEELFSKHHSVNPPYVIGRNGLQSDGQTAISTESYCQPATSTDNQEPELPIENDDVDDPILTDTSATSSSRSSSSRKGTTAKKLEECNSILSSVQEGMKTRAIKQEEFQDSLLELYKKDMEANAKFREDLLAKKDEKLTLLKELFGKK